MIPHKIDAVGRVLSSNLINDLKKVCYIRQLNVITTLNSPGLWRDQKDANCSDSIGRAHCANLNTAHGLALSLARLTADKKRQTTPDTAVIFSAMKNNKP